MEDLFLHLVNMSLSASPLILLVVLVRWLMKKTPRWIICLLWAVVALRLICPFSFESPIGLMPSQPPVTESQVNAILPGIIIQEMEAPQIEIAPVTPHPAEAAPAQITFTEIATVIWAVGVSAMLLYLLVSYLRLRYMVQEAIPLCQGVWLCDAVKTPFILGVFFPKIYLPSGIRKRDMVFVIAHETAHLKRKDHCWKPLSFLLLSVFWFNPLIWVAYLLMSKDIELACDEKVIHNLGMEGKKAYSSALLECSSSRKLVFACPVAFGEVAVKDRIFNILNYKKPAFWIVAVSLAVILIGAICFMATPPQAEDTSEEPMLVETEPYEPPTLMETTPVTETVPEVETAPMTETSSPASTDDEWADHPDGIRIESYEGETFTAQVMLVRDPAQVIMGISSSSGFDTNTPGKRLTEVMAETNAAAAINGGKFFDDGTGSSAVGTLPIGTVFSQGQCVWDEGEPASDFSGFVGFNEDNILVVSKESLTQAQAEELNIRDGCVVGPALIINGEVNQDAYNYPSGYLSRTAIGQRTDGAIVFVCINGRWEEAIGGSYADIIDIIVEYGAVNACNLNGGSSSTMMYRDTYGKLGEPGQVQMVNTLPALQSAPRQMPDYWLVLPLKTE